MSDPERSVGIKDRLHEWSVPILLGVPVFLALITATIVQPPFLNQHGESVVIALNFSICLIMTAMAGLFQHDPEIRLRRRVARAIADGFSGVFIYVITYQGLRLFLEMLRVSRWMTFG